MKSTFFKSTVIVVVFTLLSKISGFGVDTLFAYKYGPSFSSDLYVFLVSIVTLIFISVGGAVSTTFSPILSALIVNESSREQNKFISNTLNIFLLFLICVSFSCFIFAKQIIELLAPGFVINYSKFELNIAINSVKIMSFTLILIGIQSILVGILNCYKSFRAAASVSIYTNFTLIIFLCFWHDKLGRYGIVYAITLGYIISILSLLPFVKKVGYQYTTFISFKERRIKDMFKRIIPVFIGSSVLQINLIIDSILASLIASGALSILNYASKLNVLVTHVIGLAIATVVFPTLSELAARNEKGEFTNTLQNAVKMTSLVIVPITILIIALKEPIISILFERGKFTHEATLETAKVLLFYSPAMIFITFREIFNRSFYSLADTKTPMYISILGVVINIVLKLIFVQYLSLSGIALATSLSVMIVTILQMKYLKTKRVILKGIPQYFLLILIISIPVYFCSKFTYVWIESFINISNNFAQMFSIGCAIIIGGILFLILSIMFKILNLNNLRSHIGRRN
ncbi:TPA: murein biosynthesis integral membrane protein MurJ [Bacillus cereus]|uniref:murein biosynthesis integral membrane protein MurJ n=1 Tax=Bacillus cereus group sp. MYBK185-1 TaxID=3450672 RepID=UPI0032F7FD2F|nr:murein biosynthesis integral membrane protein MurJ [Bacillus cereus]